MEPITVLGTSIKVRKSKMTDREPNSTYTDT